jgi:hypothetical protein
MQPGESDITNDHDCHRPLCVLKGTTLQIHWLLKHPKEQNVLLTTVEKSRESMKLQQVHVYDIAAF